MRSPRGVTPLDPGPGQESVWDYPRPPLLQRSSATVTVRARAAVVASTNEAYRVMETSHPPTWYLPRSAVDEGSVRLSSHPSTTCEWKGAATYWDVRIGDGWLEGAAWSYQDPTRGFREITGHLAFLASDETAPVAAQTGLVCDVDGEVVRPQPGGFYGGWITDDVVGPFKGIPGSWGW